MKKILNHTLILLAGAALMLSCAKEVQLVDGIDNGSKISVSDKDADKELVTITATLPENLATLSPAIATKVSFEPNISGGKTTSMSPVWEAGDAIRIYNHADHSDYSDFELTTGAGTATAKFSGTLPGGSSYDAEVMDASGDDPEAMIVQPSDGVAPEIKYFATATDFTDISAISFTTTTGILALSAKMPADVAGGINSVSIKSSEAIFPGGDGKSLTIGIDEPGDTGSDNILNLFAPITAGTNVPAGTSLLVQFNAPETGHTVYTRYVELGATTFTAGKVSTINVNAVNSASYANASSTGIGTSANPYLIGDGYQLAAVNSLATGGQTTYFKMIDDVDMTGITHNQINTNSGYTQFVNFDGNYKTVSNLGKNLFYVFKGSIQNLTLSGSSVGTSRGIFAEFCQGTGHTITNVDITGGSMISNSSNSGALIGRINNGSDGVTSVTISDCDVTNTTVSCSAAYSGGLVGLAECQTVISNCTVASSNVTGTGVVGGVMGFANAPVTISGCQYTGGTVTGSGQYVGGFVGSIQDASVFTDCQVENATVNANSTDDPRAGGFAGIIWDRATVSGCTVGTSSTKVTINTKEPTKTGENFNVINAGGFVGVCYGTITKNEDVYSKAYAKITSTNTQGTPLHLGGFVGYHAGVIEYCDAAVDMSNLSGQHIGGFAGFVTRGDIVSYNRYGNISYCTESGTVTGNNYTAGFIGHVSSGDPEISHCSVSGSVAGQSSCGGFLGASNSGVFTSNTVTANVSCRGTNNGGFAGSITGGSFTYCSVSGNLESTSSGNAFGGFAGRMTTGSVSNCTAGSNSPATTVSAAGRNYIGGFIGSLSGGTVTDSKSYGTVTGAQCLGGFFGLVSGTPTISGNVSRCTVTGSSTYVGGFVGRIAGSVSVTNCQHRDGKVWSSPGNVDAYIGGFAGYIGNTDEAFTATVSQCYVVSAAVDGETYNGGGAATASGRYVGGFAGRIGSNTSADNTGSVEECGVHNNGGNQQFKAGAYLGAFAGRSDAKLEKCYVEGNCQVYGYGNFIGGLVGWQIGHTVKYCYSSASSTGNNKTNVGGLIGYAEECTVEECYSKGTVNTTSANPSNEDKRGGVIGVLGSNVTLTKLIRWHKSNNTTIVGGETSVPAGCYVRVEADNNNFPTRAGELGWSTDGTRWDYPEDGGAPSLVGVTAPDL
ncbi:MAG: hypothetical protein J6Y32_01335 [Bacteroidales bacterium]|nr:hypothetical protein [Bacteroidales bacterium]